MVSIVAGRRDRRLDDHRADRSRRKREPGRERAGRGIDAELTTLFRGVARRLESALNSDIDVKFSARESGGGAVHPESVVLLVQRTRVPGE